ncbi:amidase family protein [Streptomyces cellulosae]|uniref:Amidase family protein n=1 Tax=Streptomyces cellulosae TaxID=1968 RepID=A0ABW7XZW9_STRCE
MKPTVGLVGRGGVIPGVPGQDSVGPIARTARDAAIVLGACRDRRPRSGHRGHSDEIALREAGATVIDPGDIPTAEQLEDLSRSMIVQAYEVKRGLNAYPASAPAIIPAAWKD